MKYFVQNQYHILKAYFQYDDQRIAEENCGEPSGFPLHLIDSEMNPQYIDLRLIPKNENKNIVSLDHLQTSLILEERLPYCRSFFSPEVLLSIYIAHHPRHVYHIAFPLDETSSSPESKEYEKLKFQSSSQIHSSNFITTQFLKSRFKNYECTGCLKNS